MKNKIVYTCLLLTALLCSTTHGWKIVGATESTKKYILECIRIRVMLEKGQFSVSNTLQQYDLSGSKWLRTLTVGSNKYRFVDTITYRPYVQRHTIGIHAGVSLTGDNSGLTVVGVKYGFMLWRGWGLSVLANTAGSIFGGIEKRF